MESGDVVLLSIARSSVPFVERLLRAYHTEYEVVEFEPSLPTLRDVVKAVRLAKEEAGVDVYIPGGPKSYSIDGLRSTGLASPEELEKWEGPKRNTFDATNYTKPEEFQEWARGLGLDAG